MVTILILFYRLVNAFTPKHSDTSETFDSSSVNESLTELCRILSSLMRCTPGQVYSGVLYLLPLNPPCEGRFGFVY